MISSRTGPTIYADINKPVVKNNSLLSAFFEVEGAPSPRCRFCKIKLTDYSKSKNTNFVCVYCERVFYEKES